MRDRARLQVLLRQGQPDLAPELSRPRPGGRIADPGARASRGLRSRHHRRARGHPRRRGGVGRRRAPDPGVSLSSDQLHPVRRPLRQARQHQEGSVPCTVGHGPRGGQGTRDRQPRHHALRARRLVRIQLPRVGHARARNHAGDRMPGGVRRDALGADARWSGPTFRGSARARAGARARRGRGGGSPASSWRPIRIPTKP